MAFPNAFNGGMGPNFRAPFPNARINEPPFGLPDMYDGFGTAGLDDHLRRMAFLREADIRARLEFRDRSEPLPPGIELNGAMFLGRDRMRERDIEMRDMRMREDRDHGRDRDRWRGDFDRDRGREGDWEQDRDGNRSDRSRERSANRDRSPVTSDHGGGVDSEARPSKFEGNDNELFPFGIAGDADRSNSGTTDRFRGRDFEVRGETTRSMDDRNNDNWTSNQPSRTIILRGLNLDIDEKLIAAELMLLSLPVKDIRLIRRSSGVSRGFAFVEFHNVADAQRWMEHTQGTFVLLNQYRASMAYSSTRDRGGNNRDLQRNDWVCCKCLGHNFKRRDFCYNCNLPRKESEKGRAYDGLDEIGTNPCNTLILRGLDALTTEEALVTALTRAFAPSQLVPIKNIVVVRDELSTSRGFGFVEFHSVAASTLVLDNLKLLNPPLEVDGKQLLINYAKNTFNTTMAYIQQKSQAQQLYDYAQFYGQGAATYGHPGVAATSGENSTNTAAAVAQAAIQQAQAVKHFQKQIQKRDLGSTLHETVTVNGVEYPVYPPPDTSSYQYEETSGYYYDPLTRLYYDANSQYYYNSSNGQYMYWDAEKSTYLPAPDQADAKAEDSQASKNKKEEKEEKEEKKDKEKVKIAKKIAKDMEKWAKSLNAQKDALKEVVKKSSQSGGGGKQESAAADAGFAMLQKVKEDVSLMPPPPIGKPDKSAAASKPGLVASYGGDSDSGEEEDMSLPVDESKLVDWAKLTCLLCKRQFQSKDILSKHTQVSELHKQNLEALIQCRGTSSTEKIEYRDRAKERREKYGAPEPPEPVKRKDKDLQSAPVEMYEEPTKLGIGGDNIGNKLLQKMGWSEGQGLGRSNQGIIDPIKATQRNRMAGLGAAGSKVVTDVGDDYRVALKKTMFARYSEVD